MIRRSLSTLTPTSLSFQPHKRHFFLLCAMLLVSIGVRAGQFPPPQLYSGSQMNLLYDRNTGVVAIVNPGGLPTTSTNWRTTWTHIVPGRFGGDSSSIDFLFYDQNAGVAEFYSCHFSYPAGFSLTLLKRYTNWSPGTTQIVPGNFGGTSVTGQTDLLLYNAATGTAGFFDVWGQGNINLMKGYNNWSPGTTHIIPGNFGGTSVTGQTDLLLYNAATGTAGFFDVWGQGNINLMKGYNNWSTGTTHIIPGNFGGVGQTDLLLYNAATGTAGFFDVWGQGNINLMKGYNNWSPGHTFIEPGDFGETGQTGQTDLMIYDDSRGAAGFFDVWGHGNLNSIQALPNFPTGHWSLMTTNFAVEPWVHGFSTVWGQAGVTFVIKGENLNGAQRVLFGGDPGDLTYHIPNYPPEDLSFSVISSTTISATLSNSALRSGFLTVVTPTGIELYQQPFIAPVSHGSQLAVVPNLVGNSLQAAVQILQQAGLQTGTVSGATGFNLVVVSQSPGAGTRVASGSSVNLVVAAGPSGFSSVTLTNYLSNNKSVYVWLFDGSSGWSIQNGGNLLAEGESVTVELTTQGAYVVADVDPGLCGSNDPSNTSCVPWQWTVMGNPQGPTYTEPMY